MPGEKRKFPQALGRGLTGQIKPSFSVADMAVGVFQNGEIKRILVAEVMVDHPLVGPGAAGDDIDSGPRQPFGGHLAAGSFKNGGAGSFRVSHLGCGPFALWRQRFLHGRIGARIGRLVLSRFFHFGTRLTMFAIGVPM